MERSKILATCMVEALARTLASLWETLKRWGWTTQGGQTSPFLYRPAEGRPFQHKIKYNATAEPTTPHFASSFNNCYFST